jgi:hypothetical protein
MKLRLALLTIALLGVAGTGCGGASTGAGTASRPTSRVATPGGAPVAVANGAHGVGGLVGDQDDDESESHTVGSVPGGDSDSDTDNDHKDDAGRGYYDKDDGVIRSYGHAASAADARTLAGVVERYYQAAATSDGALACSLTYSVLAEAIPEDYGQAPGPSYLRGAKTCQAVMSRLFQHRHGELTGAVEVTGVRVEGKRAYVLLGSVARPASFVPLQREAGAWKIDGLLSSALP